jgi:hypothetical protein
MSNGVPVDVPVAPAAPVVVHTLPADSTSGLAFLDVVSLSLQNTDTVNDAVLNVIFTPVSGPVITQKYAVPSMEAAKVLDEAALGGPLSGLGGATISLQLEAQGSTAARGWGWFVRTRG